MLRRIFYVLAAAYLSLGAYYWISANEPEKGEPSTEALRVEPSSPVVGQRPEKPIASLARLYPLTLQAAQIASGPLPIVLIARESKPVPKLARLDPLTLQSAQIASGPLPIVVIAKEPQPPTKLARLDPLTLQSAQIASGPLPIVMIAEEPQPPAKLARLDPLTFQAAQIASGPLPIVKLPAIRMAAVAIDEPAESAAAATSSIEKRPTINSVDQKPRRKKQELRRKKTQALATAKAPVLERAPAKQEPDSYDEGYVKQALPRLTSEKKQILRTRCAEILTAPEKFEKIYRRICVTAAPSLFDRLSQSGQRPRAAKAAKRQ